MKNEPTEMEKRKMLRLSNKESNRLTRECLQTALLRLLSQKELDKISVTELVKTAGVSRTAFYSNYDSKEELLISWANDLVKELSSLAWKGIQDNDFSDMYRKLFEHVRMEAERIEIINKAGLQNLLVGSVEKAALEHVGEIDPSVRYLVSGWWGMSSSIIFRWYNDGMTDPIDRMCALCCSLSSKFIEMSTQIHPNFPDN